MSAAELKNKITKSLDVMDVDELKQAWIVLKEINAQKNRPAIATNKKVLELQLASGIAQLNNGEGTDFTEFIGTMKAKYGSK